MLKYEFQLHETDEKLARPVIVMQGSDAAKLVSIVNTQSEARIRVIYSPQEQPVDNVEVIFSFVKFNIILFNHTISTKNEMT